MHSRPTNSKIFISNIDTSTRNSHFPHETHFSPPFSLFKLPLATRIARKFAEESNGHGWRVVRAEDWIGLVGRQPFQAYFTSGLICNGPTILIAYSWRELERVSPLASRSGHQPVRSLPAGFCLARLLVYIPLFRVLRPARLLVFSIHAR